MAVANTYTLEHSYGSRVVVRGAGFLLNNEMIDFNWCPGVTNRATARSARPPTRSRRASACSARRRRRSWPKDGKVVLVTGSPGSRTIINTVLCVVVNVIDFDMDVQAGGGRAAAAPSSGSPTKLRIERIASIPTRSINGSRRWATTSSANAPGRRPLRSGSTRRPASIAVRPMAGSWAGRPVIDCRVHADPAVPWRCGTALPRCRPSRELLPLPLDRRHLLNLGEAGRRVGQ